MKKFLILVAFSTILFSCSTTQPVAEVVAAPTIYVVDDYYVLMSDAYHLRPGMNYDEVESVLKQDPYEIHQNINDNCIILSYHMKRNNRIHSDTEPNVPMLFYASSDGTNLTYSDAKPFYLILDTEKKTLRTYFSAPNNDEIARYSRLLRRSSKVCENPKAAEDYMSLWSTSTAEPAKVELNLKGFLSR